MGPLRQPPHTRHPVRAGEDVGAVRRRVGRWAEAAGVPAGRVSIVATELASNIIRHAAGQGYLLCQAGGGWLELLAVDRGPGMGPAGAGAVTCPPPGPADHASPPLPRRGSLGVGLASVRRLASGFDCYSGPGGTVVLARFGDAGRVWPGTARWGAVNVPLGGEGESGDGWAVARVGGRLVALVVDGLGHGPAAAAAAAAAVSELGRQENVSDPSVFVRLAHEAMRGTRGGVLGVGVIDPAAGGLVFAGVGNISGRVLAGRAGGALLSHEGTAGTHAPPPRPHVTTAGWRVGSTLILASDGIRSRWDPLAYPGLLARDPSVAAAVLHRDHERGRDDATVLVVAAERGPQR